MTRLLLRKLLLIILLVPLLHLLGFFYAASHPAANVEGTGGDPAGANPITYSAYLQQIFNGDLGQVGSAPISEIIVTSVKNSLVLLALTLVIVILVGPLLGYLSISRRTQRVTTLSLAITLAGASLPGFFLGVAIIALMIYGIIRTGSGLPLPLSGYGLDNHLILPVLVLAIGPTLQVIRVTANMLENELHQDYVRVAQSQGLSWPAVFWRHTLPNVISAIILAIGRSARSLIGGLIVAEALFLWPGIGRIFTFAIGIRIDGREPLNYYLHPQLLATLAVVFGLGLLLADLLTNLFAHQLDPRLRYDLK